MSIAWRLAQAGAEVAVFDAGVIGSEASWAGAGMLAPGGEYEGKSAWTDLALHSLSLYPAFVEELTHESGVHIDFRVTGAFDVAFNEEEAEKLEHRSAKQAAAGIYSEQFDPRRVPGLRPDAVAARYYPNDAAVNPREVMAALRTACERAGVRLREHSPIGELGDGSPAPYCVLAAGAWSSQIQIMREGVAVEIPRAFPIRGHLLSFAGQPNITDTILRHNHTYLLRRSSGMVIAGSSAEDVGFERRVNVDIAQDIADRVGFLVPALANRGYTVWNGFRPASETGEPVTERVGGTSAWLAYGHYRNGILLAPATAEILAREIMQASSQTG
jgi:glycine oxidase